MIVTWLGRAALYVCFIGAVLGIVGAIGVMEFALVTHNFSLAYVAENNASFTPLLYSITGLWSALEGSLMLWVLLQSAITWGVLLYYRRDRGDAVVGWATIVLFSIGAFFTLLMMGPADPFLHNAAHVLQGAGPNALLQDNPCL